VRSESGRRLRSGGRCATGLALVVTAAVCVLAVSGADARSGAGPKGDQRDVIVVGHRGASGSRPEHTLDSYRLAIKQCADYIEPDVVSTRDHVLVARHENDITGTTDVADHPEFADRQTTKVIDGASVTGWFTEDFTLAELKTLQAKERTPDVRPDNAAYDGKFKVPTLKEVLDLARRSRSCKGKRVGVYPETKHPSYFDSVGLSLEEPLVQQLHAAGYRGKRAAAYIQSFEVANLQQLRDMTQVPLVQLVNCGGQPWDFTAGGDPRTYTDLVTPAGLDFVRTYAAGVAVCKDLIIPRDGAGNLATPSAVVTDAHARRLVVHPWTFRKENQYLPTSLRRGADPNAPGDLTREIDAFLDAEIDGFFTDNPDIGRRASRNA
jgi:glycerophosphoryl diester phosphodiesterase